MKFKSVVLVAVVFLISALSISVAAVTPKFGIKVGLSWSDQTVEFTNDYGPYKRDMRTGFAFGNFIDIRLTPMLELRLEALYVQKGSQKEVYARSHDQQAVTSGLTTIGDRVDYMSLSISGKANLLSDPVGLYLMAGPRLDIMIGGEVELWDLPPDSLYNSTVGGLILGGGVEKSIGRDKSILLELRYDLDLTDAGNRSIVGAELAIKSRSFQILSGIRF